MNQLFPLQPFLKDEWVNLLPLQADDFEELYAVASDPLIWEQHPNRDRYRREVFTIFFEGAMSSGGAFRIIDARTRKTIGSSRFYDVDMVNSKVSIGYTFFARSAWGLPFNRSAKLLMLEHAFQFVNDVKFHIGAQNIRSQKAIEKLGARKTGEAEIAYHGETSKLNFIYLISKSDWQAGT